VSTPRSNISLNWPEEEPPPEAPPYPVGLSINEYKPARRLWAIPIFGFVAKFFLLVPHVVALASLGWLAGIFLFWYWGAVLQQLFSGSLFGASAAQTAAVGFVLLAGVQLVLWVWVLFDGRYPHWGHSLLGGYLAWLARVIAFGLGLTDRYPPFSLELIQVGRDGQADVSLTTAPPQRSVRWWAIPLIAIWGKLLILVPHFICLAVLSFVSGIAYFILWIPVLVSGRYPTWGYTLLGGTLRWGTRVNAYLFGLTDVYPPFVVS
jgi:hypothetical protein